MIVSLIEFQLCHKGQKKFTLHTLNFVQREAMPMIHEVYTGCSLTKLKEIMLHIVGVM